MIANKRHPKLINGNSKGAGDHTVDDNQCIAHQELNDWQIEQYRRAVEENMWYMGERLGRSVEWGEAEYDFLKNGYYGCAPKWRVEFCSHRCSHYPNCKLGQLFVRK